MTNKNSSKITVTGGGSWGCALASCLLSVGHQVTIWVKTQDHANHLANGYSPHLDMKIPKPNAVSTDLVAALKTADYIIYALPTGTIEEKIDQFKDIIDSNVPIIWTSKGFIKDSEHLIPEFCSMKDLNNPSVILSGPSFADEVVSGKHTEIIAASTSHRAANSIKDLFTGSTLCVHPSDDPLGVATCGAIKNVFAIAAGITTGLNLGDNAQAALLCRGIAETRNLVTKIGGNTETVFGLAGIGDTILTCRSTHSRNFSYGYALGKHVDPHHQLVEGKHTVATIVKRAKSYGISMPVTECIHRIINGNVAIESEIRTLFSSSFS